MYDNNKSGSGQSSPLILFATPPSLDQLLAITVRLTSSTLGAQLATRFQPQVIKCREFIFTEPDVIGTPSLDINDHCFFLITQVPVMNSGRIQSRLARIGLKGSKPYPVTAELYQACLRYTLCARISPNWNKAGPWLIQGRDFLTHKGCANAVKMDLSVNYSELYFTLEAAVLKLVPLQPVKAVADCVLSDFLRVRHLKTRTGFMTDTSGKGCLIQVTDLDIHCKQLDAFLKYLDAGIDQDSIASDWCYVLPSMKRGRIVRISHEIPEDSPFRSYRDLKRHWKNIYGYRLPENDDEINFYQIHFGPLGGKLFTYPEVCLRSRDFQRLSRIDPKPILRALMLDIQNKFPTICGCPLKLQSKAKFTVNDLLSVGQAQARSQPNLTGKMLGPRPAVYRSREEMERLLTDQSTSSQPPPTVSSGFRFLKSQSSTPMDNNMVVKQLPKRPVAKIPEPTFCPPPSSASVRSLPAPQTFSLVTGWAVQRPNQNELKSSRCTAQSQSTKQDCLSRLIDKPTNEPVSSCDTDTPAHCSLASSNQGQGQVTCKLFPQFQAKKPPIPAEPNNAPAKKIVPIFNSQKKQSSVATVGKSVSRQINSALPSFLSKSSTQRTGIVPTFQRVSSIAVTHKTVPVFETSVPSSNKILPSFQKHTPSFGKGVKTFTKAASGISTVVSSSQTSDSSSVVGSSKVKKAVGAKSTSKKEDKASKEKKQGKRNIEKYTTEKEEQKKIKKMKKAEA